MRALIVIPAFDESQRLSPLFAEMQAQREAQRVAGCLLNYLLVDDGSAPEECRRMKVLVEESGLGACVGFFSMNVNAGKGAAIQAGFKKGLEGGFDVLGFIDADGSVPIADMHAALKYLLDPSRKALAGVIGSRVPLLGRSVRRGFIRHCASRLFAFYAAMLFDAKAYDVQCGLKIFRAEPLRRFMDVPMDKRWVWDTELLMSMLRAGEALHEFPVNWKAVGGAKLSLIRDPIFMALQLLRFRFMLDARLRQHSGVEGKS